MLRDCWIWTGYINWRGYGQATVDGKQGTLVHRAAYEALMGPIPDGLTIDHLCFNPVCYNPAHMQLATLSDNARRQRSAAKTHCVNGHEFTPENTYQRPHRPRGGRRDCRACIRARVAAYKARKRDAA